MNKFSNVYTCSATWHEIWNILIIHVLIMHVLQTFDKHIYNSLHSASIHEHSLGRAIFISFLTFAWIYFIKNSEARNLRSENLIWETFIWFFTWLKLLNYCKSDNYIFFIISPWKRIFICSKLQNKLKYFTNLTIVIYNSPWVRLVPVV